MDSLRYAAQYFPLNASKGSYVIDKFSKRTSKTVGYKYFLYFQNIVGH